MSNSTKHAFIEGKVSDVKHQGLQYRKAEKMKQH
jgi:hypothetical protein